MLKDWIRPLLRPLPQWSTIALAPSSRMVIATLRWDGQSADVTADHTVASLQPLMIATSLDAGQHAVIEYSDSVSGIVLGVLHLLRSTSLMVEEVSLTLYHVAAGHHRCLGWPRRTWNAWLQNRHMLKNRASTHFNMDAASVQQLMIAYLCPRPVVLVSIGQPGQQNIFPMDLIGTLERSRLFTLALRSTNVSEPVMREARQVALSSMPAAMKAVVYKLSEHHKRQLPEWGGLPCPVRPSQTFGIPVVAEALRIRELAIVHSQPMGLHTFFVARVVSEEGRGEGAQLHHTAGFHQAYRLRWGIPFPEV
jgi:flavin reductase (DIM6/NTAB) family NADH-FMN oxidoreductase RutF